MGMKLAIPICLQAKEWDRHKSIIGKIIKKKTGITEALKDFEKAYNNFGWSYVDSDNVSKWSLPKDEANLAEGMKYSRQGRDFCQLLQKKLAGIKKLAHDNFGLFKGNPLIPKTASAFLEKMWATCDTFHGDVYEQLLDSSLKIQKKLSGG
jgi:hypothetical protein